MRIAVLKTYKIYIAGLFPRTESGRYYPLLDKNNKTIANMCLSSRKDFRNAVVAAKSALASWAAKTHFNRSQILYRIAEILEGRRLQFEEELILQGATPAQAKAELNTTIDRWVYFAGWADKYQQLFSTVNPVASSHFNFSVCEPTGVVSAIAPSNLSLLGISSIIAPIIAGGNSIVILASESKPLCAITLAEVLSTSDLPAGVVNILTGNEKELVNYFSNHMEVNAMVYANANQEHIKLIKENASLNVKRIHIWNNYNWIDSNKSKDFENPYVIGDLQEIKTTWHPIEYIGGAGGTKY